MNSTLIPPQLVSATTSEIAATVISIIVVVICPVGIRTPSRLITIRRRIWRVLVEIVMDRRIVVNPEGVLDNQFFDKL